MITWYQFLILPTRDAITWVPLRVIDFPPRNQHRFIARVWAREFVLICNEPMVVQQIATLLKKLSFRARLVDFFSTRVP